MRDTSARICALLERIAAGIERLVGTAPASGGAFSLANGAKVLDCSQSHLKRMAKDGQLRLIRLGPRKLVRVPAAEIARLLAGESCDSTSVKTPAKNGRLHVDPGAI
jgi:hypothetical protein